MAEIWRSSLPYSPRVLETLHAWFTSTTKTHADASVLLREPVLAK